MSTQNFIDNLDTDRINEVVSSVENNITYFTDISDQIVNSYTAELDELLIEINKRVISVESAADSELEFAALKLSNMLYYMGSRLENIGIKDDLSKLAAKESYNQAYLDNQVKDADRKNKTTVAELTAIAENASRYDTIMNSLYSRIYKQIKYKIDAGYELLSTIKKIISKRIADTQLAYNPSGKQLLLEEVQ